MLPRRVTALDPSPFGINSHLQPRPMEKLAGIGIRWHRIDVDWDAIESAGRGVFEWRPVDAVVETAGRLGLSLLASIAYTPPWARSGTGRAFPPHQDEDFARFVQTFLRRYRGRIACASIWNEPDLPQFWNGTPQRFQTLYVQALTAAREEDPELVLCGPDLSRRDGDVEKKWLRPLLDVTDTAPGGPLLDVVTHHQYAAGDKVKGRVEEIEKLQRFLSRRPHSDRPLWVTEIGWNSKVGAKGQVTEDQQAQRLREVMGAMQARPWWAKTFWYDSHGRVDGTGPAEWGILGPDEPHREKGAFLAYRDVVAAASVPPTPDRVLLSDAEVARRIAAGYRGILGREPDPVGAAAHETIVRAGKTMDFCRALFGSPEFQGRAKVGSDLASQLYRGAVGREPTSSEGASAVERLTAGRGPELAAELIEWRA